MTREPPSHYLHAGLTRANDATSALSPAGQIAVTSSQASGSVYLVLDVNGYFE